MGNNCDILLRFIGLLIVETMSLGLCAFLSALKFVICYLFIFHLQSSDCILFILCIHTSYDMRILFIYKELSETNTINRA